MHPEQEYHAFLKEGRFMLQRGKAGGNFVFHPRVAVPGSGEAGLEWVEADGEGVVYSTTVVRNKPPLEDHNIALIDLVEGVRLMSRVVGIPAHSVRIGMRVKAFVGEVDGQPAVLFEEWRA